MVRFVAAAVLASSVLGLSATEFKGKVVDSATGEELIGACIQVKGQAKTSAVSGLDGSFEINAPGNRCTLTVSYIGYETAECTVQSGTSITIPMSVARQMLQEVVVMGVNNENTEISARAIEQRSMNVVNVMSSHAMLLSPDQTVGASLQRMSGVTVERNESGEGQYAILRGMDKRYNYTLVNGVKIPSPDNKNRFVPLDIFPSELLDRLEVHKSLTPDQEGDGIGGAVNLVMKNAPANREFSFNLSTGYNSTFFCEKFNSFAASKIEHHSPNEIYGVNRAVTADDFTTANLRMKTATALPDLSLGAAYGDRFFDKRFGVIAAVSFKNNYRGKKSSLHYLPGKNYTGVTNRLYTEQQARLGTHVKMDYQFNPNHSINWYNGFINTVDTQVRDAVNPEWETVRMRMNHQYIINSTLSGNHKFFADNRLKLDWHGVFSKAFNETPDNAEIKMTTATSGLQTVSVNPAATRRWEHNSDRDRAGYADLRYELNKDWTLSVGGMYRDKKRDSYFNEYTFKPIADMRTQVRGTDWTNFDEILLEPNSYGNLSDPLNYDAAERIGAGYAMAKFNSGRWQVTGGVRAEHTEQSYFLKYPTEGARNSGVQKYWDILPSVALKYEVHNKANLHLGYCRAINRPGFFEIVPYNIITEDYKEHGNPDLKHTIADNIDLRYEYFPRSSEQFMVGLFYKHIQDPIEYGLRTSGQDTYYMPDNYGMAKNYGVELDAMKYFNKFGVKANYTFTHSAITTQKTELIPNPDPNAETTTITRTVDQTRPLSGQAAHVVNLSLLFKDSKSGWEAQVAGVYTSKRICSVSRYLDNDIWEDGFVKLDISVEKHFGTRFGAFLKANNVLNSDIVRYVPANARNESFGDTYERHKGGVLERREQTGSSFTIGFRYKM